MTDNNLPPTDRQPTTRILAMPSDTNPMGNVFGGWIMSQMDIAAGIKAREFAKKRVVTVAMTSMEFLKPVNVGDIISCYTDIQRVGNTSMTIKVEVFAQRGLAENTRHVKVTEATAVFVAVDENGHPISIAN